MNVMNMGRRLVKFIPHSTSERSHQGERNRICTEYGKTFSYSSTFIQYWRVHIKEKPSNVTTVRKLLMLSNACKPIPMKKTYEYIECGKCFTATFIP